METYRAESNTPYVVELTKERYGYLVEIQAVRHQGPVLYEFGVEDDVGEEAIRMFEDGQPAEKIGSLLMLSSPSMPRIKLIDKVGSGCRQIKYRKKRTGHQQSAVF